MHALTITVAPVRPSGAEREDRRDLRARLAQPSPGVVHVSVAPDGAADAPVRAVAFHHGSPATATADVVRHVDSAIAGSGGEDTWQRVTPPGPTLGRPPCPGH